MTIRSLTVEPRLVEAKMCHNWILPGMAETRMCQIWGVPLKPRFVEANMFHYWIVPEMAETRIIGLCQKWQKLECAKFGGLPLKPHW